MEISGCGNQEEKKNPESRNSLRFPWRRICSRVVNLSFMGRAKTPGWFCSPETQTHWFLIVLRHETSLKTSRGQISNQHRHFWAFWSSRKLNNTVTFIKTFYKNTYKPIKTTFNSVFLFFIISQFCCKSQFLL